jgi:Pregnancy-associated plasma protein-A
MNSGYLEMIPMETRSIIALFAAFWLGLSPSFSQNECGTRFSTRAEQDAYEGRHAEFLSEYSSGRSILTDYKYIPMYFHIVRQSDGSGGISLTSALEAMMSCNDAYMGTQIRFFYCGHQYINNSTYYEFHENEESALVNPNRVNDVANVFVVNSIMTTDGPACGYAYYPNGTANTNNHILMDIDCMDGPEDNTLEHEFGHFFDLPHTHGNGNTSTELVNGSNCTTNGDLFCDTPADPNLSGVVSTSCVYTGTATDANGQVYVPNTALIMSYSHKPCRTAFSAQQIAKMNFTVSPLGSISRRTLNCTNCPAVATYNDPYLNGSVYVLTDYYRRNAIESNVDLTVHPVDQPNLGFIATERIRLLPGFHFDTNSPQLDVFRAEIDPCTP